MSPEELDEARAKEADRLWGSKNWSPGDVSAVANIAARLARENWTPPEPEPVDPDVEAYWRWRKSVNPTGRLILNVADAYLAGARMAREQERGRANMPIGMAGVLVDRCQRMMHSLPPGVRAQWDAEWGLVALCRAVAAEIAKYMGEA